MNNNINGDLGASDDVGNAPARLPLRVAHAALQLAIACLIAIIFSVASGVRWLGGPSDSTLEPFIVHCVLTALGLSVCGYLLRRSEKALPASEPHTSLISQIGMVALGLAPVAVIGVNGYLAIEAIRTGGEKLWVVLFIVPAALAFVGYWRNAKAAYSAVTQRRRDVVAESLEGFWGALGAHLRHTVLIIAVVALIVAALFFGIAYAVVIEAALIGDRFLGWDIFIHLIQGLDEWELLELMVPLVVIAVVYPVFGLGAAIWVQIRRGGREGFDRDLSSAEIAAIESYARDVETYVENTNTTGARLVLIVWALGFLLFLPLTFLFYGDGLGAYLLEPMRAPAEGWYIYNDGPGGGEAMGFVTLFPAWCLLLTAMPLFSNKMSVLSFEGNAEQNLRGENVAETLRRKIAVDIRRGDLRPEDDFDPAAYLRKSARKLFRLIRNVTLCFFALTLVCFAADRADYELIAESGIKYRNYLSADTIEAKYTDIAEIDLICRMTGADDERSLSLFYKFVMQNGDEIFVVSATNPREARLKIPRRLDAWENADALARDAGVPAPARRYTWRDEIDRFEVRLDECQAELTRLLDKASALRVIALFTTDSGNVQALENLPSHKFGR
ncbi:MAG: hypothetical protein AAF224_10870 [Pseudomonadota bacterium]